MNLILLTVDSLRADMPWAGYEKPIAPYLSQFAKNNVVYENHRTVSSSTAQVVGTWITGRYASTLSRTGTAFAYYSDENVWITEAMQQQGITTLAVHAHPYFERASGSKQGFARFEVIGGTAESLETGKNRTGGTSVAKSIELLSDKKIGESQFFLWTHLMDPHHEYTKHAESPHFGDDDRARYDAEVFYTDLQIGRLIEFFRKQPWWDSTALIISSDHGEAFGEHGLHGHGAELWDVLTKVPLLIRVPGVKPQRISEARTHLDIAPTILDLMGLSPIPGMQGQSMAAEIYGREPAFPREAVALELSEDTENAAKRALVVGNYKLIVKNEGKTKMLFDLNLDPGERSDLSKKEPTLVNALADKLEVFFSKLPVVPAAASTAP